MLDGRVAWLHHAGQGLCDCSGTDTLEVCIGLIEREKEGEREI